MDAALTAAVIGVGGTVIVGVAGFWANVRNTSVVRQGQVTDRYTKAIEQLGSKETDVRVGGIYALQRIARDSARDRPTVIEVLAAFVRDHSHEQWPLPTVYEPGAELPERTTRPDVQAAVTVIGRSTITKHDRPGLPVNLQSAVLASADLRVANFASARLNHANLTRANLTFAHLNRAYLNGADLTDANLTDADLTEAFLTGADPILANLEGAGFTDADLTRALWPADGVVPQGWARDASGRLKRIAPAAETERNQTE